MGKLQDDSGAKIDVSHGPHPKVSLRGTAGSIERAKEMISDLLAEKKPPGQDGDRQWQKTESIRAPWSDATAPKMQAAPAPKMQATPNPWGPNPWAQSEAQLDPLVPTASELAAKRTPSRAVPSVEAPSKPKPVPSRAVPSR